MIVDKQLSFVKAELLVAEERLNMDEKIHWMEEKRQAVAEALKRAEGGEGKLAEHIPKLRDTLAQTDALLERERLSFEKQFSSKPGLSASRAHERERRDIYQRKSLSLFQRLQTEYEKQREADVQRRCEQIASEIAKKYRGNVTPRRQLLKRASLFLLNQCDEASLQLRWNHIRESLAPPFMEKIVGKDRIQEALHGGPQERRKVWLRYLESMAFNIHFDRLTDSELIELLSYEDLFYRSLTPSQPSSFRLLMEGAELDLAKFFSPGASEWVQRFRFFRSRDPSKKYLPIFQHLKYVKELGLDTSLQEPLPFPTPNPLDSLRRQGPLNLVDMLESYRLVNSSFNMVSPSIKEDPSLERIEVVEDELLDGAFEDLNDLLTALEADNTHPQAASEITDKSLSEDPFEMLKYEEEKKPSSYMTAYEGVQRLLYLYRYEPFGALLQNAEMQQNGRFVWTEDRPWPEQLYHHPPRVSTHQFCVPNGEECLHTPLSLPHRPEQGTLQ